MGDTLLPCPFCGGEAHPAKKYIFCLECGAEGPSLEPVEEDPAAIYAWNKRAKEVGDGIS